LTDWSNPAGFLTALTFPTGGFTDWSSPTGGFTELSGALLFGAAELLMESPLLLVGWKDK
jgi:hypothetical protein